MTHLRHPMPDLSRRASHTVSALHLRRLFAVGGLAAVLALAGCATTPTSEAPSPGNSTSEQGPVTTPEEEPVEKPAESQTPEETCDWDSPRIEGTGVAPAGQEGELAEVLIGAWQHTYTDEGSGFEAVTNDHRYILPSPDRMLYCQHVPGATDYADQGANVVLNDKTIELPGGKYGYTVTVWDNDTMVWDNPVGGGYLYLLERR